MGMPYGFMFDVMPIIVTVGFVCVFGIIIATFIKGISQWNTNNNSPVLTVFAKIVTKRADTSVSSHSHNGGTDNHMNAHHTSSSTTYYVTFEVESGDRMELLVQDREYGILVEGDSGRLTFQGTRYKGFERSK